jgi:hypothetical protein
MAPLAAAAIPQLGQKASGEVKGHPPYSRRFGRVDAEAAPALHAVAIDRNVQRRPSLPRTTQQDEIAQRGRNGPREARVQV